MSRRLGRTRLLGTCVAAAVGLLIPIVVQPAAAAVAPTAAAACTVTGTRGDDVLLGTPGSDVICGLAGNDRIDGAGGADVLRGDEGVDVLRGGNGDDLLVGADGRDDLDGGAGDDRLDGGRGDDVLHGGPGLDVLVGERGDDRLNGGPLADALDGGAGRDSCVEEPAPGSATACETSLPALSETEDSDGDGLSTAAEQRFGSASGLRDSDGDGLDDADELQSATDPGLSDADTDGTADRDEDPDQDGSANGDEAARDTSPLDPDSDDDRLGDGAEAGRGTDPLAPDTDADGVLDGDEVTVGTDPLLPDTDQDGIGDADDQVELVVETPGVQARLTARGVPAAVLAAELTLPADERMAAVPGVRGPPVQVLTGDVPLSTSTLTMSFDASGVTGDDRLAVLHFDESTGTFDRPADQVIDATTGTATVTTDAFSPFVVVDVDEFESVWADRITTPRTGGGGPTTPVDVVLALDSSGSMQWNDPSGARKVAASAFVDALLDGDRVAVVDFDSQAVLRQPLTSDFTAARNAIQQIDSSGGTNLSAAMMSSLDELDRAGRDSQRIIVLLTDGVGTYSSLLTQRASASGVTVYTVGLGAETDEALLGSIASATGGRFYLVQDAADLGSAFNRIGDDVGAQDSDGDGLADDAETTGWRDGSGRTYRTDPEQADTDGDGLSDGQEAGAYSLGSFGDYFPTPSDPTRVDTDADGLEDIGELDAQTKPRSKDSDRDGLSDTEELAIEFDPLDSNPDGDTFDDSEEQQQGSDPFGYDLTVLESGGALLAGFVFGDAWDTGLARFAGVNLGQASSLWYLIGQLVSGYVVIGDVRDLVYNVATASWGAALLTAVAFVPVFGDAGKTVADLVAFARKSATAFRSMLTVLRKVLPRSAANDATVRDVIASVVRFSSTRLPQDIAVAGRRAPVPNFDIATGLWQGGRARTISNDSLQDTQLKATLDDLRVRFQRGETIRDVRVNQQMTDTDGAFTGRNRPDLQYTSGGERYYVEWDRPRCADPTTSTRGDAHFARILSNDVTAFSRIVLVVAGTRCD